MKYTDTRQELNTLRKMSRHYAICRDEYIVKYRNIIRKQFSDGLSAEVWSILGYTALEIREMLINIFSVPAAYLDDIYDSEKEKYRLACAENI